MRHSYTAEEMEYLKLITPGKTTFEITKLFNSKFNVSLSRSQIRGQIKNKGICSGIDARFKPGNTPYYKGTKGLAKSNNGSFKKGHQPHNQLPVGKEVKTIDGYYKIKVADPNVWIFSHRYIYMQHYGDIPKDTKIIFLDKDKENLLIDNLSIVTSQELQIINRQGLLTNESTLSETGVLTAKLIAVTHNRVKEVSS